MWYNSASDGVKILSFLCTRLQAAAIPVWIIAIDELLPSRVSEAGPGHLQAKLK